MIHEMKEVEPQKQRDQLVRTIVEALYVTSEMPAARWMWDTHVQFVAEQAALIAERELADIEKVVSAALLHDVGDVKVLRSDESHESESDELARTVLAQAGFTTDEIEQIMIKVIGPHSAYPENMPQTVEAKVLSTADAIGHLGTNFYTDMTVDRLKLFGLEMTAEQHRNWVLKKIARDFRSKTFFEEERAKLEPAYEEIKRLFT